MLCQNCHKNNANVKIVKNYNGNVEEKYLCSECAKEYENDFDFSFPKDNFFENLFDFFTPSLNMASICKNCNEDFETFKHTGMLSCPDCYNSFEDMISPMIKNIHGNIRHIGKVPGKNSAEADDNKTKKSEVEILKEKLQQAIKDEKYEEAAVLRDKIKSKEE